MFSDMLLDFKAPVLYKYPDLDGIGCERVLSLLRLLADHPVMDKHQEA